MGLYLGKCKACTYTGIYNTASGIMHRSPVLATEIRDIIALNLDIPMEHINYFTDNKVVLGYLNNNTRRFYTFTGALNLNSASISQLFGTLLMLELKVALALRNW